MNCRRLMALKGLTHIVAAAFGCLAGLDTPGQLGGLCQRSPEGTHRPRHSDGALRIQGLVC